MNNNENTSQILPDDKELQKIANVTSNVVSAQRKLADTLHGRGEVLKFVNGDIESIEDKLKSFGSSEKLSEYIKNDENVNSFFIDNEGNEITLNLPKEYKKSCATDSDIVNMKRQILVFLKQSQIMTDEFQKIVDDYNKEQESIEKEMGTTVKDIVIDYLRYSLEQEKSIKDGEKINSELSHLLSGFDFRIEKDTLKSVPSIVEHTLKDFRDTDKIKEYGERYRSAINKANSLATLISFISNYPDTSIEESFLPPDKYKKGYENFFIFSLVRYYAMTYWTPQVRRMHAMTISILQQFLDNTLPSDLKERYAENISSYLEAFYG